MLETFLFILTSEPGKIGATIGAALLIGGTLRIMDYNIRNVLTWLIIGAVFIFFQFWLKSALGFYVSAQTAEIATFISAIAYFSGIVVGNLIVSGYSKNDIGKPLREIAPEIAREVFKMSGTKEKQK